VARPAYARPSTAVNPMSTQPRSDDGTQMKNESLKRQQVVLDEASKRFRRDEK